MRMCDILTGLRESRNMSQMEMARRSGISQSTISALEKGTRQPSMEMLDKLAEFFNVPKSTFVNTADAEQNVFAEEIANCFGQSPKMREVFDSVRYMDDEDLDAVLSVIRAMSRNR